MAAPTIRNDDGSLQGSVRGDPTMLTGLFGRTTLLTKLLPNNRLAQRNVMTAAASGSESRTADWVSGACMLVRRAAVNAVGGFDEQYFMYWEDADFCRRVRRQGGRVVFLPTTLVRHEIAGSSSFAPARNVWSFHRSALRLYLKHAGLVQWGLLPLTFAALCLRGGLHMLRAALRAPLKHQ